MADGLPIITTVFEEAGIRWEIEQFAFPLLGPPTERRGDIPMVLLQKVALRELQGEARRASIGVNIEGRKQDGLNFRKRTGAIGWQIQPGTVSGCSRKVGGLGDCGYKHRESRTPR